jgi:hypothetical protein
MHRHAGQVGRARQALQSLADHRQSTAADLNTTLVLWAAAPDFSTDAGNSALIVNNEVSATSCNAISACPAANEKTKNETSAASQLGSPGREMLCHGRSFLVGNSSLLPPCRQRH